MLVVNPLMINYEDTYWRLHSISNLLLEIKLVQKKELKHPTNFLQHLAAAYLAWAQVNAFIFA